MTAHSGATGATLFTVMGTQLENLFGRAVAGLGDFDQDGKGDFALGVPNQDSNNVVNRGHVHAYRGAVTDIAGLEFLGAVAVSGAPEIRLLGTPNLHSLLLLDVVPGPTPIPPWGFAQLGFSAAMAPLNDSVGVWGTAFGSPLDSQGILRLGPFAIPPVAIGTTIWLQAFNLTPAAPNGYFQRTNGISATIAP